MIHVVTGAPCSGKSTYVQEHSSDGDVIVDYDLIAQALGSKTPHDSKGAIREAAFKARTAVINYLVSNANDVEGWIIHSNPADWQIDQYEKVGAEFVKLDVDEKTCIERAEQDGRPADEAEKIHNWFESNSKRGTKMIKTKTYELKADNGTISGYASTFIREPDSYGDIVAKGAFLESIEKIKNEGRVIPLLYNHNGDDLNKFIGTVVDLEEDDHGLKFEAVFDSTPEAQRARELAMDGRLAKFSFAYDVLEQGEVELEDGRKANELRKLDIHEVSLVLYPANTDTSIVSVKSGRRNSAKDAEKIRQIIALAQEVLGELDDTEEQGESNAKAEEPDTVNAEEQEKIKLLLKEAENLLAKGAEI